jgi:hypothetical protein
MQYRLQIYVIVSRTLFVLAANIKHVPICVHTAMLPAANSRAHSITPAALIIYSVQAFSQKNWSFSSFLKQSVRKKKKRDVLLLIISRHFRLLYLFTSWNSSTSGCIMRRLHHTSLSIKRSMPNATKRAGGINVYFKTKRGIPSSLLILLMYTCAQHTTIAKTPLTTSSFFHPLMWRYWRGIHGKLIAASCEL